MIVIHPYPNFKNMDIMKVIQDSIGMGSVIDRIGSSTTSELTQILEEGIKSINSGPDMAQKVSNVALLMESFGYDEDICARLNADYRNLSKISMQRMMAVAMYLVTDPNIILYRAGNRILL